MQVSSPPISEDENAVLTGVTACTVSKQTARVLPVLMSAVHDLGKVVKDAVQKQGMLGWQYNTIGVSDAITMGGDGMIYPHKF